GRKGLVRHISNGSSYGRCGVTRRGRIQLTESYPQTAVSRPHHGAAAYQANTGQFMELIGIKRPYFIFPVVIVIHNLLPPGYAKAAPTALWIIENGTAREG